MKKKVYEKPTMRVVKIQQQHIVCSSPGVPTLNGTPGSGDDPDEWMDLE